jgi:tRNA threonylcarbamoyladenosine biosynthesis protein TsaB
MTILALEFSSEQRSVAVARDGIVLAEAGEIGGRATNAFGLIEKVLAESKIGREEIEIIAVGLGPGSYTGIRTAIAVAQGWQLARGIKLLGISSVEAIAAKAQGEKIFGRINVAVDAQRGEFYLATWEISETARMKILPLKIVTAAEMDLLRRASEIIVGPETEKTLFPSAGSIARLAAQQRDIISNETLMPIYLREVNFVKLSCPQ